MNDRHLHFNSVSWIGAWAVALVTILSTGHAGESSWTLRYDFNAGTVDEKVAGLDATDGTRYTKEQSFEGGKAAVLEARRGRENYGRWGGRVKFPSKLRKGDEVWWRVRTFWPKGMDYTAEPRLKFLRVHTCSASGKNQGYNDIYINKQGSKIPFQFIYEGAQKWSPVSDANDAIVPDTWETYEYYVKLDNRSLISSHNPGPGVYNLDATLSLPAVLMEMLVYSKPGVLDLLPGLPPEHLPKGSIEGMLARCAVTIERLAWDIPARTIELRLRSKTEQTVSIGGPWADRRRNPCEEGPQNCAVGPWRTVAARGTAGRRNCGFETGTI